MKRTSLLGVISKRSCRSSQNCSTSVSSVLLVIDLDYHDIVWFALETNRDHSVVFEILDSFVDYAGYSISSKRLMPTVVDKMFI